MSLIQYLVENGCGVRVAPVESTREDRETAYQATLTYCDHNGQGTGDTPELAAANARDDLCSRFRYRMHKAQKEALDAFDATLILGGRLEGGK